MRKIKIIELFSGIGAQVAALKRLGLPYEVVGISEIDKYAIKSYEAINNPTFNYGDITKINALDYADLWTYSFPCQDLSNAGKQAGIKEGTRSGLLLHVERLLTDSVIRGNQPKYLLLENVKALVSKKFKPDFERWLDKLEQLGYNNYWQVLNAKDYGIPQNRERVFVVSIRKDVDTKSYKFPEKIPLQLKLKDLLESNVSEKYYLSQDKVDKLLNSLFHQERDRLKNDEICNCLCSRDYKGLQLIKEVSNTIRVGGRGSLDNNHSWDLIAVAASRGRNPDNPSDRTAGVPTEQRLEINQSGCSNTLTTVQKNNMVIQVGNTPMIGGIGNHPFNKKFEFNDFHNDVSPCLLSTDYKNPKCYLHEMKIRKLTPLECWRLMGFTDEEFILAQLAGVSNSQLYKQAGNSIVIDVLVGIFKELFNDRS